jgi:hypothetical protein
MSLERVLKGFEAELEVLTAISEFRCHDSLYQHELQQLEASVSRLESKLACIEKRIDPVEDAELDRRIALAYKQRDILESRLAAKGPLKPGAQPASLPKGRALSPQSPADDTIPAVHAHRHGKEDPSTPGAVTEEEFSRISSYMRGRLTVDKVNKAIQELTRHAEKNRELVATRKNGGRPGMDRKHANWLSQNIAKNAKSKFFVVDTDLKHGHYLQMGSTSTRSILTLLRHIQRIAETRVSIDGTSHVVYSLLYMQDG